MLSCLHGIFSSTAVTPPVLVVTGMVQVGNGLSLAGNGGTPSLAPLDGSNVAMWNSATDLLEKYSFDGTDWTLVGNALSVLTGTTGLAGLGPNRVATCNDFGNIQTYDFDGTDWSAVGNASASIGFPAGQNYMVALSSTEVAVATPASGGQLRVYSFDGTDWTNIGTNLAITQFASGNNSVARLDGDSVVIQNDSLDEIRKYTRTAGVWSLDGSGFTLAVTAPAECGLLSNRIVHVDNENDELRIYDFDTGAWSQVGSSLSVGAITSPPTVASMSPTRIAYYDGTSGVGRELRAYDVVLGAAPTAPTAPILLDSFETVTGEVPTGGVAGYVWAKQQTYSVGELSALNVTEGSGSYKASRGTGTRVGLWNPATNKVDISAYEAIQVDVTVESVATGDFAQLYIFDSGFDAEEGTPVDQNGSFTITTVVSAMPDRNVASIGLHNSYLPSKDTVFYFDNLRGIPNANQVTIEDFETIAGNIPTGGITWTANTTSGALVTSTYYKTEGTNSGEMSLDTSTDVFELVAGAGFTLDLSAYSKIRVDVLLDWIGTGNVGNLILEDGVSFSQTVSTTAGVYRPKTLEIDISSANKSTMKLTLSVTTNSTGGTEYAYWDNLRGVLA